MLQKIYLDIDVLTAARQRISYIFDECPKIYLSFSAGKDSGVMFHLVMDEAIKRNRKVGVLLVDLEAQYKLTIDYGLSMFEKYKDNIEPYWISLPLHMRNAVSQLAPQWVCWGADKKDIWVRQPPEIAITDQDYFPFYRYAMEFEEFIDDFSKWYANGEKCFCFVGIRSDESLNRYRTIVSTTKKTYKGKQWTTQIHPNVFNSYPIYDWKTQDIWTYNGKYKKEYNRVYDLMHSAGLTIHQARLCQPYGDDQRKGLYLFHILEPKTWGKVCNRVSGANQGALYADERGNILGVGGITKPGHLSWKQYANVMLDSMPKPTAEHYKNKIAVYLKWYKNKGLEDIPDWGELNKEQPSWMRICKMLLRNDYWAKSLSFTPTSTKSYQKYLELMKKRRTEWDII